MSFSREETEKLLREEQNLPTLRARVLAGAAKEIIIWRRRVSREGFFEIRDDMILALNRLFTAKNMATSALRWSFSKA